MEGTQEDGNTTDETEYGWGEDLDFNDSGIELDSQGDDNLYEHNVMDGIKVGLNVGEREGMNEHDVEVDAHISDLEYPSSKELMSDCPSDDEVGYRFPQFMVEDDMSNPQFVVGQLFRDVVEFQKAVRTYKALNGYSVRFKANDEKRVQGICKASCSWRIWASTTGITCSLQVKSYTPEHTCNRDQYIAEIRRVVMKVKFALRLEEKYTPLLRDRDSA